MTATAERGRSSRIGLLQVVTAGVLWGTGGVVVTLLNERDGIGAMAVSSMRLAVAAGALAVFVLLAHRHRTTLATFRGHPVLVIGIGCGTALYQGLYFVSVLLVGVSIATVVSLGLAPVLAACWEHAVERTWPSGREVAVLAAALAGLVLISLTAGEGTGGPGDRPVLGLALAIGSGVTYAATTVLGHRLAQRVDPIDLTTCSTVVGAVVLAPFLVVAAVGNEPVLPSDPTSVVLLAYLGVMTMAVSYVLLYAGLRTTSSSTATLATLVEPLSAALVASLVLGERLPWPALLGGVLILGAVAALRPANEQPVPV